MGRFHSKIVSFHLLVTKHTTSDNMLFIMESVNLWYLYRSRDYFLHLWLSAKLKSYDGPNHKHRQLMRSSSAVYVIRIVSTKSKRCIKTFKENNYFYIYFDGHYN
jgi:hypothetical protein